MNMVKFKFDIRNKLFTMKVEKYWNKLPSEVMDAALLELFQVSLYGAIGHEQCKMSLLLVGNLH